MYGVIVICSKNSLYSQFRKEADFTPACQVLFYIQSVYRELYSPRQSAIRFVFRI